MCFFSNFLFAYALSTCGQNQESEDANVTIKWPFNYHLASTRTKTKNLFLSFALSHYTIRSTIKKCYSAMSRTLL